MTGLVCSRPLIEPCNFHNSSPVISAPSLSLLLSSQYRYLCGSPAVLYFFLFFPPRLQASFSEREGSWRQVARRLQVYTTDPRAPARALIIRLFVCPLYIMHMYIRAPADNAREYKYVYIYIHSACNAYRGESEAARSACQAPSVARVINYHN